MNAEDLRERLKELGIARLTSHRTALGDGYTYTDFSRLANMHRQRLERWVMGTAPIDSWVGSWLWMWQHLTPPQKNELRKQVGLVKLPPSKQQKQNPFSADPWHNFLTPKSKPTPRLPPKLDKRLQCEECGAYGARWWSPSGRQQGEKALCLGCKPARGVAAA